jgi:hypothetical protein
MNFGLRRLNSEYKGRRLLRSVCIYFPDSLQHYDIKELDIEMIAFLVSVWNSTSTDVRVLSKVSRPPEFEVFLFSVQDKRLNSSVIPAIKVSCHALRN